MNRITRLVALLNARRHSQNFTVAEIAANLECSERTVHRDLEFIRDQLCVNLVYSREHNSWRLSAESKLPWLP